MSLAAGFLTFSDALPSGKKYFVH
jgi:hypothetical protein